MTDKKFSRRNFVRTVGITGAVTGLTANISFAKEDKHSILNKEKSLTFLFQGDSITDGNWGRNLDPNHILGHGYVFAVSSRIGADFPEANFKFINRGVSGNTTPDLKARWQKDALDLKSDVLSLLVGINDVAAVIDNRIGSYGVVNFEKGYKELLQRSKEINPEILFVLGLPFVFPIGRHEKNWKQWNEETLAHTEVVQKMAIEFNAVLVDYPKMFANAMQNTSMNYWIWDGIHPTVFGHELMAREWIKQVSSRLSFFKNYDY